MQRIDYDFDKLRMRRSDQKSAAVRAKAYDGWVGDFSTGAPSAPFCIWAADWIPGSTGSTLPSTVRWYDIDLPDVIELRRRLFPSVRVCTPSPPR